jgi:hypothetical protein
VLEDHRNAGFTFAEVNAYTLARYPVGSGLSLGAWAEQANFWELLKRFCSGMEGDLGRVA